jgi:hypothetical protein
MKEIIVEISPDGAVHVEAFGYRGNSCEEATKFIEEALGETVEQKRKPEYYRQQRNTRNQQRLG